MAATLPALPSSYKNLQHYLKIAAEHESRDPVVSYYCRLYSLQKGMEIDKKAADTRAFLVGMMDLLEAMKKEHGEKEAMHNEVVGQAHMEEYALKLFLYADNEDRAGRFGKNVVKTFYMASKLMDVLTNFGELQEDLEQNRKYAQWKAAYIHRCLQNGQTPIAGPLPEGAEGYEEGAEGGVPPQPGGVPPQPGPSTSQPPPNQYHLPAPGAMAPPTTPSEQPAAGTVPAQPQPVVSTRWQHPNIPAGVQLKAEDYNKAVKYCKYAGSALQYEDSSTAIDNLTKALNLLTTGHE